MAAYECDILTATQDVLSNIKMRAAAISFAGSSATHQAEALKAQCAVSLSFPAGIQPVPIDAGGCMLMTAARGVVALVATGARNWRSR